MSNSYLYVFSPKSVQRSEVGEFLNEMAGVEDWFFSMPNAVFIIGSVPARALSKNFIERFGQHRHFITLISKKARAGWMPKDHWRLLDAAAAED
jgi:hypothetical protein